MSSNIFDRISFYSILLVVVLLPIFFLSGTRIPVEAAKGLLLVSGLVIALLAYIIARIKEGRIVLPKSNILLAGGFVVLATLISAIFSASSGMSFFGIMLDTSSFWFIFVGFLTTLLAALTIKEERTARLVLLGVLFSTTLALVFQIFRISAPNFFSLGVFAGATDNLLGSWNSLGFIAGFSVLFSVFLIEFFQVSKILKWFLIFLIVLSLLSVAAVNFSLIWILVGFFSLIFFVYKVSLSTDSTSGESKPFPYFAFLLVLVSLLFLISPWFLGSLLPNRLGVSYAEVRPAWSSTISVGKGILGDSPIMGIGPNRWSDAWAQYKPLDVNITQFWDVAFGSGAGTFPSIALSTGGLGILAWILLIIAFFAEGIRSFLGSLRRKFSYESVAFLLGALYFLIVSLLYSPSTIILVLFFVFTGIFIGLVNRNDQELLSVDFSQASRKKFLATLIMVVIMLGCVGLYFKYLERLVSVHYYNRAFAVSSLSEARGNLQKAILLNHNDLYLRTFVQAYFSELNSTLSKTDITEEEKASLQNGFSGAINASTLALKWNKENYLNYQALGMLYAAAGVSGSTDSYNQAIDAYSQASALNPRNPRIHLEIARLYFALGDLAKAREHANISVSLKDNYLDALLALSEIENRFGNRSKAISHAERALSLYPDSQSLRNYVENLRKGGTSAPVQVPTEEINIEESEETSNN